MQDDTTIAAIATAGNGAIGIVRLSGASALSIADRVFSPISGRAPSQYRGYTGALGRVHDAAGEIDEAVLFVYRAPRSYTGEDAAELCCHGGSFVLQRVLSAVIEAGAVPAAAGEFTKRALLNGKLTLTAAESVADIISSENRQALRAALAAHDGALHRSILAVADSLTDVSAHLAAWTDYPEEDVEALAPERLAETLREARAQLDALISGYGSGRLLREGVATAIVGAVNVGKSTLMNLLSGCPKSIVTEIPGTTRDVVEERVSLGEISLLLQDTAGLRDTGDAVERIGVARSLAALERCDVVLAVFDGSRPLSAEDRALLPRLAGHAAVGVINKTDLPLALSAQELDLIGSHTGELVRLSAQSGEGAPQLAQAISRAVGLARMDPAAPLLANARQLSCAVGASASLAEALAALAAGQTLDAVSVCVEEALDALLELTGRRASAEIIDRVFERFCVGK